MLQGSLETRFMQSTSDYADVLHTRVIERAKAVAAETGLRQLIDDTTEGVLLLKYGNSVLCWLTGIPSSRKDYTGTKIRYAIALEDESRKMPEWAGILCGLYSNQKQLETLGTFLDGFIDDNKAVKPDLTFDDIAAFLKDNSKIKPVQTDGIDGGCEFVLASYLADSEDCIISAISKVKRAPSAGVFWNESGFNEVKKKISSKILPKQASPKQPAKQVGSNQFSNQSERLLRSAKKTWMMAGVTVVMILLVGIGAKMNSDLRAENTSLNAENSKLKNEEIEKLKNQIQSKNVEIEKLKKQIQSKNVEIGELKKQIPPKDVKPRGDSGRRQESAGSTENEKTKPKAQPQDNKNQSSKKADKSAATQKK